MPATFDSGFLSCRNKWAVQLDPQRPPLLTAEKDLLESLGVCKEIQVPETTLPSLYILLHPTPPAIEYGLLWGQDTSNF